MIVILSILRVPFVDSIVLSLKRAENVGRVSLIGRHLGNAESSHLHNATHLHIGIFSCASMAASTIENAFHLLPPFHCSATAL